MDNSTWALIPEIIMNGRKVVYCQICGGGVVRGKASGRSPEPRIDSGGGLCHSTGHVTNHVTHHVVSPIRRNPFRDT